MVKAIPGPLRFAVSGSGARRRAGSWRARLAVIPAVFCDSQSRAKCRRAMFRSLNARGLP